jgi:hypothetical protein
VEAGDSAWSESISISAIAVEDSDDGVVVARARKSSYWQLAPVLLLCPDIVDADDNGGVTPESVVVRE